MKIVTDAEGRVIDIIEEYPTYSILPQEEWDRIKTPTKGRITPYREIAIKLKKGSILLLKAETAMQKQNRLAALRRVCKEEGISVQWKYFGKDGFDVMVKKEDG